MLEASAQASCKSSISKGMLNKMVYVVKFPSSAMHI